MSKKKEARQREEHAALAADIDTCLTGLKEKFAAVNSTKDPAKKILELLELNNDLRYVESPVIRKVDDLAYKRTRRTPKSLAKKGALTLVSLTIVGFLAIPREVNWYSSKNKAKKKQELCELLDVDGFVKTVNDYRDRTAKALDEAIRHCDLKEVIKSPYYPDALDRSEPLKKRFEAAAFARAAFGDESRAPETAAPEDKPSPPRSTPAYPEIKL